MMGGVTLESCCKGYLKLKHTVKQLLTITFLKLDFKLNFALRTKILYFCQM